VAGQAMVDPPALAKYSWADHRVPPGAGPRGLGFRGCREADEERLASWLAEEVCPFELGRDRLREALLTRCRVSPALLP
jgi:hypothetical protein